MAMKIVSVLIVLGMMVASLGVVSYSVDAADQGWQTPAMLQPIPTYVQSAAMGMDDQGNAMVVWEQYSWNYTTSDLWAARYDAVAGWQTGEMLWEDVWWSSNATVAVSPYGQAVTAWYAIIPTGNLSLHARFYDPLLGWGTPEIVDYDPYPNWGDLVVDIDPDGNVLIVGSAMGYGGVIAWYYDVNTSWSKYSISPLGWGRWPSVGFDDSGCALALWSNLTAPRIESSRFSPSTGWGPVEAADGGIGGSWGQMDVNESGFAVATFVYDDGYNGSMYGNVYDPSSGWGVPTLIGPANGGWYTMGGYVAHGAKGEFFVVWDQWNDYSATGISPWSVIWSESSGWSAPTKLTMASTGYNSDARIAANANGQAMAVWSEDNGMGRHMAAARYTPASGWGSPAVISSSSNIVSYYDGVAMAANGNAVAFWLDYDGTHELIWGNAYLAENGPPLSISQPMNGEVFLSPTAVVMGTTDPNASLVVSGLIVAVEPDGSFEVNVALVPGMNEIWARATNESGTTSVSVMVEYIDIVPDLNQQIVELMNQIALLGEQLNQSNAQMATALAEIVSLTENMTINSDMLNQTFDEFNQTMAEFEAAQAELLDLMSNMTAMLNQTFEEYNQTLAELDAVQAEFLNLTSNLEAMVNQTYNEYNQTLAALDAAQTEIVNLTSNLTVMMDQYWLLQDEMNDTLWDLTSMMSELNSTYGMIDITNGQLNTTNEQLNQMIANYTPMANMIANLTGNLTGTQASLWDLANATMDMQNELTDTKYQLNNTKKELSTSQGDVSSLESMRTMLIALVVVLAVCLVLAVVVMLMKRKVGGGNNPSG